MKAAKKQSQFKAKHRALAGNPKLKIRNKAGGEQFPAYCLLIKPLLQPFALILEGNVYNKNRWMSFKHV